MISSGKDAPDAIEAARQKLLGDLAQVSFPTLGHFLEEGFADYRIRSLLPEIRMIGTVITLKLADADAIAVNQALAAVQPGDVLVIDMQGDHAHAPVGLVTATRARTAGAAGIVIDGVATDILELRNVGLPVFSRGTSVLTTKPRDTGHSVFNGPVRCGGVTVEPGMIAVGDANGVLFARTAELARVLPQALASDQAEPGILEAIRSKTFL